jgi:hypothetical protein
MADQKPARCKTCLTCSNLESFDEPRPFGSSVAYEHFDECAAGEEYGIFEPGGLTEDAPDCPSYKSIDDAQLSPRDESYLDERGL